LAARRDFIAKYVDEIRHQRGLPILHSESPAWHKVHGDSSLRTVVRAEKFSALQSRGGDGFSPSSRARSLPVIVDGAAQSANAATK
jgi:hypothetical protein